MKRKEYQQTVGREERKRDDHEVAEEGPQQRTKHVTDGRMRTGSRQQLMTLLELIQEPLLKLSSENKL